eukprot:gnl/TRDRNA2_/TRDRNA2_168636_c0_seq1.p1 gnl/TRDRNA2_/TRDRNA2_168636_c0~~gnl/TRDRNA2_/TRDRNA2_168636_c0_seq1.p1  ORF type:complete len:293 (+),score=36.22 gnl/TRDRNA2_/TRDRNA2_168636_c0_seq1:280-1158(+)
MEREEFVNYAGVQEEQRDELNVQAKQLLKNCTASTGRRFFRSWAQLFTACTGNPASLDRQQRSRLSTVLSYCSTFAWCLKSVRSLAKPLRKEAVSFVLLGASEAECSLHPELWQWAVAQGVNASKSVRISFVGPEVHATEHYELQVREGVQLTLQYFKGSYSSFLDEDADATPEASDDPSDDPSEPKRRKIATDPDAVFAFNPGFTCPDYSWDDVFDALRVSWGMRFIIVSNTKTEVEMDMAYLDQTHRIKFEHVSKSKNPFPWLPWLQSGTLANDVYRKSSHLIAGVICVG